MFAKSNNIKSFGQVVASLGILFVGLSTMSTAMRPMAQEEWFINIVANLSNPLLGVLVGVIFTVIIQSASASVGVLQIMAVSGVIDSARLLCNAWYEYRCKYRSDLSFYWWQRMPNALLPSLLFLKPVVC